MSMPDVLYSDVTPPIPVVIHVGLGGEVFCGLVIGIEVVDVLCVAKVF